MYEQEDSEQEQEKPRCPCYDGNFNCKRLNVPINSSDVSNFCESTFDSCPAYNGEGVLDNNAEKSIEYAFERFARAVYESVYNFRMDLSERAGKCCMESINEILVIANYVSGANISVCGRFTTILSFEEENAKRLDSKLNSLASTMIPRMNCYGGEGSPTVSSEDFEYIEYIAERCCREITDAARSIHPEVSQRFEWAINDIADQMIAYATDLPNSVGYEVVDAKEKFKSAVNMTKEAAGSFGHPVLNTSTVKWEISD